MSFAVQPIPMGARLIDTDMSLTLAELQAFKDLGGDGIIAYLGGNLTSTLLSNCAVVGLGVTPVNFSRKPGWLPTAELGTADAKLSVMRLAALASLGVPVMGLDDWCDVEGCGADPTAYATAWCIELTSDGAGRVPNSYEGAGSLLNGAQWYRLPFRGYWHSGSAGIPEPQCGFKLLQLSPLDVALANVGIVDYTVAQRDRVGRPPTWLKHAS